MVLHRVAEDQTLQNGTAWGHASFDVNHVEGWWACNGYEAGGTHTEASYHVGKLQVHG